MDTTCLEYGFIISIVVSFLKRWPWAANNPKVIAFLLTAVGSAYQVFAKGGAAMTTGPLIQSLVTCAVAQLGTAVGTHEVIVQPVKDYVSSKLIGS